MNSTRLRRLVLVSLTVLITGAVLFLSRSPSIESRSSSLPKESPQSCLNRMLLAEENGDARTYLDCFSAIERERLDAEWHGLTPSQITADLRGKSAGSVGQAVTGPKFTAPEHATLELERITRDHTLQQEVKLERIDGRWQITSLSIPERKAQAIPYGTPVSMPE